MRAIPLLLTLVSALATQAQASRLDSSVDGLDPLIERAYSGDWAVLVELAVPFALEAEMDLASIAEQRAAIEAAQDELLEELELPEALVTRFEVVPYLALEAPPELLPVLAEMSVVGRIVEDGLSRASLLRSTEVIEAQKLHRDGDEGAGQVVAILDTGIDTDHPVFEGRLVDQACFSKNLCPNNKTKQIGAGAAEACTSLSGCGHGTHVAGIAAGAATGVRAAGVAPKAKVLPINVFSRFDTKKACGDDPPCLLASDSHLLQALQHVYKQRKRFSIAAVNMSLGGGKHRSPCNKSSLRKIIQTLQSAGIATVIASGNDGYVDAVSFPACVPEAVTVGATDARGYSAEALPRFTNNDDQVDLLAPGVGILAAWGKGGWASASGTSMAAPHVTGALAALRSATRRVDSRTLVRHLASTGVAIPDPGRSDRLKRPSIRLAEALSRVEVMSAFFFMSRWYRAYSPAEDRTLFTMPIDLKWAGFPDSPDAVVNWGNGKAYVFKDHLYWRIDARSENVDPGYPRRIADHWPGLFPNGIEAAVNIDDRTTYFFRGDQVQAYDMAKDRAGPARSIADELGAGLPDHVDAALRYTNGKVYLFSGSDYYRWDPASKSVDPGYPGLTVRYWPGMSIPIDAAFVPHYPGM